MLDTEIDRVQGAIRLTAIALAQGGDDAALTDYFVTTLTTWLVAAMSEQGSARACQLLAEGLETMEAYRREISI